MSAPIPLSEQAAPPSVKHTPVRIVVADSGDLAYEYEAITLTTTLKAGGTRAVEAAGLRVWQKDQGQWKVAASFAAPFRK